jgi:hypothetical protein
LKLRESEKRFVVYQDKEFILTGDGIIELLSATVSKGGSFRFKANGFSMTPFIRDGDIITILPLRRRLSAGEVAVYICPKTGKLIVHRVIKLRNGMLYIKGDNSFSECDKVPYKNILGFVGRVERKGRNVSLGLGPEGGIIALFSRAGLFFLLLKVWKKLLLFTRKAN